MVIIGGSLRVVEGVIAIIGSVRDLLVCYVLEDSETRQEQNTVHFKGLTSAPLEAFDTEKVIWLAQRVNEKEYDPSIYLLGVRVT